MSEIKQFEPANAENDVWYARMNAKDKAGYQKFVTRANYALDFARRNGVPKYYHDLIEENKKFFEAHEMDVKKNASFVSDEAVFALDDAVSKTIWDVDIFGQIMAQVPGVQRAMQYKRMQIKDYLLSGGTMPRFTKDFRSPVFLNLGDAKQYTDGIGLMLGLQLPFTAIEESQGGLWDPYVELSRELAARMGVMKSRRGFLGTASLGALDTSGGDASGFGITGLFNYASAQTFNAGIGDQVITTQGDFEYGLKTGLTDLRTVYQPGQIFLITTGGVFCEALSARDTYQQKTDLDRLKEILIGPGKPISQWWITEDLYAAAPSATAQQAMLVKLGPDLVKHWLIYPQQTIPSYSMKIYENDISEVMIYADAVQYKKVDTTNNAVPVTVAATMTTTRVGWLAPQRVV